MTEQHLRNKIIQYLQEQEIYTEFFWNTALLCLIAGINGYSFSNDMINDLPQFIPSNEEINKYK